MENKTIVDSIKIQKKFQFEKFRLKVPITVPYLHYNPFLHLRHLLTDHETYWHFSSFPCLPNNNKKKTWTRLGRSGDLSVAIPCLISLIPIRVRPCCSGLGTTCHFFRPLIPIQVRGRKSLSGSSCHSPPPHVPSFLLQDDRSFGLSGQCLPLMMDGPVDDDGRMNGSRRHLHLTIYSSSPLSCPIPVWQS